MTKPRLKTQGSGLKTDSYSVGDRISVVKPGHAIGSAVRLKVGDRGVVTQADPTGDIVTVNFEFRHVPGGLRVWCASIELIPHDPPTPKAAE